MRWAYHHRARLLRLSTGQAKHGKRAFLRACHSYMLLKVGTAKPSRWLDFVCSVAGCCGLCSFFAN
jgi:hypothetical protein